MPGRNQQYPLEPSRSYIQTRYGDEDFKRSQYMMDEDGTEYGAYESGTRTITEGAVFLRSKYSQDRAMSNGLAAPVILPQRRPEDRSRGWTRAFAPALQDCGIDEQMFLQFIDDFNKSCQVSECIISSRYERN
jgi:hypothetical protein